MEISYILWGTTMFDIFGLRRRVKALEGDLIKTIELIVWLTETQRTTLEAQTKANEFLREWMAGQGAFNDAARTIIENHTTALTNHHEILKNLSVWASAHDWSEVERKKAMN